MSITQIMAAEMPPAAPRAFGLRFALCGAVRPRPKRTPSPIWQAARQGWHAFLARLSGLLRTSSQILRQILARSTGFLLARVKILLLKLKPTEARSRKAAIRALLRSEASATVVRLMAYFSAVGLIALTAGYFIRSASGVLQAAPAPVAKWVQVAKPFPAFSVSLPELADSHPDYAMRRHVTGGGRQDILDWGELKGTTPHLMIEIYRPAAELASFGSAVQEIAARLKGRGLGPLKSAGEMQTKFGTMSLVEFSLAEPMRQCLGFVHAYPDPQLQILGWHCISGSGPVPRNLPACALDRLSLLAAGSEPKVRKLFARAELKRNFCGQRSHLLTPTPKLGPSAPPPEPRTAGIMARRAYAKSPGIGLLR
jgi:hypothetical protein